MKGRVALILSIISVSLQMSCAEKLPEIESIRINSLGYLTDGSKVATIVLDSCSTFYIKAFNSNKKVYEGVLSGPIKQGDVGQSAYIADFSGFTKEGKYYIEIPGMGTSKPFRIGTDVYNEAFKTSFRAFYLLRCGTRVEGVYAADTFKHEACHMEDGWMTYTGFGDVKKDGTGGWHDAGDYGKYTVNAGITIANLFLAWQHFGNKIKEIALDLPETAPAYPEFLKELKWETDYLLKMQYSDGSGRVSHKLTGAHFEGFILPEDDLNKRYFSDWGSDATANFTATMAMASRFFKPYDTEYAKTCLTAALSSYAFLEKNPEDKPWDQKEIQTGAYRVPDKPARLWAAAELWETTGDEKYLKDFEEKIKYFKPNVDTDWDWGNVKNLGMFTYVLSDKPGRNAKLLEQIKRAVIDNADSIVNNIHTDIYGRPFNKYFWGCNGTVARLSLNLSVANMINPDKKYEQAAQQIIAHLFGRNYYGRSYVTGVGVNPPMNPHDRRSGSDNVEAPWPGYIVGGGHSATDWVDDVNSYSHNEVAINWQAALVYSLAWFTDQKMENITE